jgi:sodium-independent sulfate anion transporter 11
MWIISLARNAIVVVTGMVLAYGFSLAEYNPFKIIGMINEGLPAFALPPFSTSHNNQTYNFQDMIDILGSSIASVPLIALLESIAIAKAFGNFLIISYVYIIYMKNFYIQYK